MTGSHCGKKDILTEIIILVSAFTLYLVTLDLIILQRRTIETTRLPAAEKYRFADVYSYKVETKYYYSTIIAYCPDSWNCYVS